MKIEAFSTQAAPHASPVRGWQDAVRRLVALDFKTKPRGLDPFQANIRVFSSPRLRFSALSVSAHVSTLQMDAGFRSNAKPYYLLAYLRDGSVMVEQDGREAVVGAGNFVIVDTSRPFRIDARAMTTNSVDLSSTRMQELFPQIEALTSICITGENGPGAALRNLLDDVFTHSSDWRDEAFDFVADAIPYLTAGALATLPAANNALPSGTSFHHRARIRRFARSELRNRDLTPEMIARCSGLSLRYIHQLFANEPATLMQWIWQERVARCGDDLQKPALRHRTISEIAYSWGFNDPSHFSRLFRAQFGKSPRVFRRDCERSLRPDFPRFNS